MEEINFYSYKTGDFHNRNDWTTHKILYDYETDKIYDHSNNEIGYMHDIVSDQIRKIRKRKQREENIDKLNED